MRKLLENWKKWLLPLCYGVFVLLWLCGSLACLAIDRMNPELTLDPANAVPANLTLHADGSGLTETGDAQLAFDGVDTAVRLVRLRASFAESPGEMELFYTRRQGEGFSAKKRVIGVPQSDGSYLYTLPPGRVYALRCDLGMQGGNAVQIEEITLNPRMPPAHYFVPKLRGWLALAVAPALACCAFYTIIEGTIALAKWRRKAKKTDG